MSIAGQIDYSFDTGNLGAGLANLDVVVYDSRGTVFTNQLDWAFVTYQLDRSGPLTVLQPDSLLIPAGANTIAGRVFDESPVPNVALEVRNSIGGVTSVMCDRPDPAESKWTCDWDAGVASDGAVFSLRARATDAYGRIGEWTKWIDFTVDNIVPTVTFDQATSAALSDALIGPAEMMFTGRITDNRSGSAVDVCEVTSDGEVCQRIQATTEDFPQSTFVYNDVPAEPLPLGAGQGCYTGNEVYRFITVSDTFTIAATCRSVSTSRTRIATTPARGCKRRPARGRRCCGMRPSRHKTSMCC